MRLHPSFVSGSHELFLPSALIPFAVGQLGGGWGLPDGMLSGHRIRKGSERGQGLPRPPRCAPEKELHQEQGA